ncbi:hypothetical protein TUM20985_02680 [Mycobacterium antarcticum]|uniref:hypothetical protein n=1 Tax=unclassified Mycolicibacterium TaxID=2636767 RepID=UPI002394C220|nr:MULTISPECIES: hypothetical protein [unclassified Mycolicibacterium]BDX29721.1 hypothetical protein TUM20985_02680 [Mycolicibacterium sp. TUM20985]GLP73149.1 hypothetical protein TUM20983_02590 [Mycolicibacterium sp. TUM20983]GLP78861.1 hypothetical protein TUM20984_02810 [Mycolicibacterium sp. TUM20984]
MGASPNALGWQWSLIGVDTVAGQRSFDPVPLDAGPTAPYCFLNGPTALLCLRGNVRDGVAQSSTAWIIDAVTGTVTYTGLSDLQVSPGKLGVRQVGLYALAGTLGQGIYGIGAKAETTWFVPGKGSLQPGFSETGLAPQTLATQEAGGDRTEVFSVVDGTVITPDVTPGRRTFSAATYPGGFAVEVSADERSSTPDGVEFFDETGRRLGAVEGSGFLSPGPADVPIVESSPQSTVFSDRGELLAEISRFGPGDVAILVGARLLTSVAGSVTEQYDLTTGQRGKDCKVYLGGYLATDGKAALFESGNPNVGLVTKAIDLATCDVLWSIESPIGSFRDVWRINTTLVQLSDDGTELMSLVAPS